MKVVESNGGSGGGVMPGVVEEGFDCRGGMGVVCGGMTSLGVVTEECNSPTSQTY